MPAALEDLEIEAEPESFRITFRALHRRGRVAFDWDGRVEGGPDGRIVFRMAGTAGSTFRRNRIGFCVLHPAEECAGRECIVETTDGDRLEQAFPALVSPHQPFRNVRAILHAVSPGVEVEVRMEGETFETEDQRNWSDASFKTYGTPLHLPYPVEVREGTRIEQSVAVSLFGVTAAPVRKAAATVPGALPKKRNSTEPVVVRVGTGKGVARPAIGLGGAGLVALPPAGVERLLPLRLAHVRADLRLEAAGWEAALERAVANARALDVPLELAVFLPDDARGGLRELASRASAQGARVASWLTFRAKDAITAEGDVALARAALAGVDEGARFGGGADGHFAELNRHRVAARGLDRLVFALNPQVHACDDPTIVENVGSLRALADTARGFAGGTSLGLSPVTLRARADPRPLRSRDPKEPPFTDDPRQATSFAAAWTLAFLGLGGGGRFREPDLLRAAGPAWRDGHGEALPGASRARRLRRFLRRIEGGLRAAGALATSRAGPGPGAAVARARARLPGQRDRRAPPRPDRRPGGAPPPRPPRWRGTRRGGRARARARPPRGRPHRRRARAGLRPLRFARPGGSPAAARYSAPGSAPCTSRYTSRAGRPSRRAASLTASRRVRPSEARRR